MKITKIGFDFDKVFVDYPPFIPTTIIEFLYKRKNGKLSYRIPGEVEKKIRVLSHHHLLRPPITRNIAAMNEIAKNKNIETYIISSRFSFLKKRTEQWCKRNNIRNLFKRMYFNFEDKQPHVFKEQILRKERIDKFIDDDLDLLEYLASRNPEIEFFWINETSRLKKLPSNIKRVKNLEEFSQMYA